MSWKLALVGWGAVLMLALCRYVPVPNPATDLSVQHVTPVRDTDGLPLSLRSDAEITARLVSPVPDERGVIGVAASHGVGVRLEVRNIGSTVAKGLRVKTGCQCHIREALPAELLPGQSAMTTVTLTAPAAGVARREVPIVMDGRDEPIAVVIVAIRAEVTALSWIVPPRPVSLTEVAGTPLAQEVVWEAVEDPATANWLEGVELYPSEVVGLEFTAQQRAWGEDGRFCLRRYRLRFTIPARVVLRMSRTGEISAGVRVTVVRRRVGEDQVQPVVVVEFDEALLDVFEMTPTPSTVSSTPSPATALVYRVRSRTSAPDPVETEVTFRCGEIEPARLLVRIESAE